MSGKVSGSFFIFLILTVKYNYDKIGVYPTRTEKIWDYSTNYPHR